jgi:alpha-D-ribose 1-methylphosphonate 5-triphosphate synthase subunit PhnI
LAIKQAAGDLMEVDLLLRAYRNPPSAALYRQRAVKTTQSS